MTILAAGLTLNGDIQTDGVIRIEGTVEGSIRADGEVLIARGGLVKGDIHTHRAIIGGRILGSLKADERVEIEDGALVEGDLMCPCLVVQEGGQINGQVLMVAREAAKLEMGRDVGAPEPTKPATLAIG